MPTCWRALRPPARLLATLPALILLGPGAAASVLVDLDGSAVRWRNDGDPGIVLRSEGREHPWRQDDNLADPLTDARRLRFPPCLPGLRPEEGGCGEAEQPAGKGGLELSTPLEEAARRLYERLWEQLPPPPLKEEVALAAAMHQAALDLTEGINIRGSRLVFQPVEEALRRAEAAGSPSAVLARAVRARDLFAVLQELWREKIVRASRDLTFPCDRLKEFEQRFNRIAGVEAVQLKVLHPGGICLFCGNVCTLRSADLLLEQMKASIAATLEPPPAP